MNIYVICTRHLIIVIAISMLPWLAYGQKTALPSSSPTPTASPTPERPRDIVSLLNDARLAAPELTVDTLLKVVESGKVKDRVWKKEILEESLRLADDVPNPVQLQAVMIKGVEVRRTLAFAIGVAQSRKLDRLNLISRVAKQMLEIDPERAKHILFAINGDLKLKPRTCSDNLTYQVRDIYSVVGAAVKVLFNSKEIADGRRALFLSPWIENIESPRQVNSVLRLLIELEGPDSEKQMLVAALQRALARNFHDDRSFTSEVISSSTTLGMKIKALGGAEPSDSLATIIEIYRAYLIKNLRSTRCKDNEIKAGEPLPSYILSANEILPQKPLTAEDLVTSDYADTGKFVDILARSTSIKEINARLIPLKGKVVDTKIVHFSGPEWQANVVALVESVIAWEGSDGETQAEMMVVRSAFFDSMLQSVDDPEFRKNITRKYLAYLAASPVQKTDFVSWYMWVSGVQKQNPDMFAQMADDFPNPNLAVMVKLKKLGL